MTTEQDQPPRRLRRPRKGQRAGITRAKYDELFRAFLEEQNLGRVAKRCRLDPRTVRRYVEQGDPSRGLRPLRERLADIVSKVQAREDDAIAETRHKALQKIDRFMAVLDAKISESFAADGLTLTPEASAAMPVELSGALDRMIRLQLSLLGEADLKVEMTSGFENLSDDDLREYVTSGKLPASPARRAPGR
ncbi:MAG: hypothetical protein PHU25_15330 [Deltaproteobacteria bacterium]|nr:hypothetical protein [Deltaproteobacteria bacterium]